MKKPTAISRRALTLVDCGSVENRWDDILLLMKKTYIEVKEIFDYQKKKKSIKVYCTVNLH